jgi:hypothetical protein
MGKKRNIPDYGTMELERMIYAAQRHEVMV